MGSRDDDIAKDAQLLDATTRVLVPLVFLCVNVAELIRILERSLRASYFCLIANAEGLKKSALYT